MTEKIRPDHLERAAYVYVRQSSLQQVRHHREGQQRQYGLADRARQLGFARVVVIDDDLGVSGTGKQTRPGFRPVAHGGVRRHGRRGVCAGGLAARAQQSRLASPDRSLRHDRTVLVDDDGVYDPRLVNDRLFLGSRVR